MSLSRLSKSTLSRIVEELDVSKRTHCQRQLPIMYTAERYHHQSKLRLILNVGLVQANIRAPDLREPSVRRGVCRSTGCESDGA
jgi:hypothetical protein